jgi:hypothetical protein
MADIFLVASSVQTLPGICRPFIWRKSMIRSLSNILEDMGFNEKPQIKGDYNLAKWACDRFDFTFSEFVCWRVLAKK